MYNPLFWEKALLWAQLARPIRSKLVLCWLDTADTNFKLNTQW